MENVSNKFMNNTFEIISNVSAIATLISFVIGFVWNYNSNKQAEKANFRMCEKFAENLIKIRQMEIERINTEIERLEREAETLKSVRDMKQNHANPEDANVISFEYSSKINNLSFTMMQLRQLVTQLNLDAVMDVDSFMKDITKK